MVVFVQIEADLVPLHDVAGTHDDEPQITCKVCEGGASFLVWIVQRELNTLGIRQIVPRGPNAFELNWTMFGYEGDDEEMTRHRLRQGNLMGPSGFLGLEDNEAIKFVQDGLRRSTGGHANIVVGGDEEGTADHLITESAIRSMYRYYREVMEL